MCSIDYPTSVLRCHVCEETTSLFGTEEHDPDWEYAVLLAKGGQVAMEADDPGAEFEGFHVRDVTDKVYWFRATTLHRAGYTPEHALALAARYGNWIEPTENVDLHDACSLVQRAGDDLAWQILS